MGYEDVRFPTGTRFLVTGGAGFIGSHLCEAILRMGHEVRCLDNLSTGKRENVELFEGTAEYEFVQGDIRDYETCLEATTGIDYVLHQAAWGSVPRSIEYPLLYEEINVRGTLNMLEAARVSGAKKFVYASSSSVYGDAPALPKREGHEGTLLSPYAVTKRAAEEYGRLYAHLYGLETYGLRYFNVFGPRQDPEGAYAAAVPRFIRLLMNDQAPVIYGDGTQSRDFTYVDNVVEANMKACLAGREAAGETFNIAFGGREYVLDMCHLLAELLEKDIKPVFGPERPGDIRHSNADIGKAREMLGYEPSYSFADGIRLAITWYRESL